MPEESFSPDLLAGREGYLVPKLCLGTQLLVSGF
jgi:hypothetical protein